MKARVKELEDSRATLLDCMKEVKTLIDSAFNKGGAALSEALPDANPIVFFECLCMEVRQFERLLSGVTDLSAFGATLALTHAFQSMG